MCVIWYRLSYEMPGTSHRVECDTIDSARIVWDALNDQPDIVMVCTRP